MANATREKAPPLPWKQRPLLMFADADPRRWASLRKQALDLTLNTVLDDDGSLKELTVILSQELGHGARCHDQDWDALRKDLQTVVTWADWPDCLGRRDVERLRELSDLAQLTSHLDAGLNSVSSTLSRNDGDFVPPRASSIRTIAAELFWTVQFLKQHDALDVKRCRREECGRWFLDLKGYTESCSDECRIRYAQGR